jgi:hypothetical protein
VVPYQSADLQIFPIDDIILAQEGKRGLVMEAAPLPLDRLVMAPQ